MENVKISSLGLALFLLVPAFLLARDIPAIVSSDWLEQNLGNSRVAVIDIRGAAQYQKGHIPGAFNAPMSSWIVENDGLSYELPPDTDLRDLLGKLGIRRDSLVVVVNRGDTEYGRADATRVAWSCITAGVKNAAVFDGGYNKWLKDKKAVSVDSAKAEPMEYKEAVNRQLAVSKSYVLSRIGKSIIADTRIAEEYFGVTSKPGHIKSAVSLPTPWAYAADGVFRSKDQIQAIASGVIGSNKSKEVILYCEVGGYASTWWYLLTQVLDYRNVKLYDGSIQEWIKDPAAPVTVYSWH